MFTTLLFDWEVTTWTLIGEMLLAGAVVILAGTRFAKLADVIADRLNIGGGWIGLILLATVTSLPELVSGGTATAIGNVDLAMGGILGSCSFNITLIVLLNALMGGGSVLRNVSPLHTLSSSFGLALIGMALMGIVLIDKFAGRPAVAQICELVWAAGIFVAYLGCMRLIYRFEKRTIGEEAQSPRQPIGAGLYAQVAMVALVIVAASWWLARLGDVLSTHKIDLIGRPLGATFVGAGFLALATSLPEITTSIAAVRLGKIDMALGNIFGSNMFNIFVIPILKMISLAQGDVLLLSSTGGSGTQNIITGLLAMLLTAIAVGSLIYRSSRKMLRRFGFDAILIAVTYVGGMILLLMEGGSPNP